MSRNVVVIRVVAGLLLILAVVVEAAHDWGGKWAGAYYAIGMVLALIALGLIIWANKRER